MEGEGGEGEGEGDEERIVLWKEQWETYPRKCSNNLFCHLGKVRAP